MDIKQLSYLHVVVNFYEKKMSITARKIIYNGLTNNMEQYT
jgi:hypothetical protein